MWGFAIYLGSTGKDRDSVLPNGNFTGSPEDALDCACGLYLGDPTAGNNRRRINGSDH
ncbi:hypothetical protein [Rhodococcus opacus]|uniref:hypothetical protein n=1 Tax=Rhodococcus opacus TaxID=37919 RepID=UPI002474C0B9|nr:hypothetical protein [Rhodococcus opacus]MDH6293319.1 hypothetical protein [Rhodococcus opacus]